MPGARWHRAGVKSEGFRLFFTGLGGQQARQRLFAPAPKHQRSQKGVEQGSADEATKNDHGDGMQNFFARGICRHQQRDERKGETNAATTILARAAQANRAR